MSATKVGKGRAVPVKILRVTVLACVAVSIVACGGRPGGLQDALKYDAMSLSHVKMSEDTYRMFEHPLGDRIMATASVGAAFGQGIAKGATLGLVNVETPEQRHEAAVRRYLDITSREACSIRSGYELVQTQYEFMIDCPTGTVATKAPPVEQQTAAAQPL